jgi:hypothetical protein
MPDETLVDDVAWAASLAAREVFAGLRDEEQDDARREMYCIIRAAIEAYLVLHESHCRRLHRARDSEN